MESKINKTKFVMDTDWIVKGTIDTEHKEYVLMSYFQKMNIVIINGQSQKQIYI